MSEPTLGSYYATVDWRYALAELVLLAPSAEMVDLFRAAYKLDDLKCEEF